MNTVAKWASLCLICLVALLGCIEKYVKVRSDPADAQYKFTLQPVDREENPDGHASFTGRTPSPLIPLKFGDSGDVYALVVSKEGYEPVTRSILSSPRTTRAVPEDIRVSLKRVENLVIVSEPRGATISVKDRDGRVIATGQAPLVANVTFEGTNDSYVIAGTPAAADMERFVPAAIDLTKASFEGLNSPW